MRISLGLSLAAQRAALIAGAASWVFGRAIKPIGDSRVAGSASVSPLGTVDIASRQSNYVEDGSFPGWVATNVGGRITFDPGSNYGVGGDQTQDVLNRMSPILNDPAHIALIMILRNDVNNGVPVATIKSNIYNGSNGIIDQLLAPSTLHPYGHFILIADDLPDDNFTGSKITDHATMRDWVRALNIPNVFPFRSWDTVASAPDAPGFAPGMTVEFGNTGTLGTGTHPAAIGHSRIAPPAAAIIIANVPPRDALLASDSLTGVLNANYNMAGTSGTNTSVTTGPLATGWVSQQQAAIGVTLTYSKETDGDGNVWQVGTLSGTPTASGALIWAYNSVDNSGFAAGDLYFGAGRLKWDGFQNVAGLFVECQTGASPQRKSRSLDAYDYTRPFPASSTTASNPTGEQIHRTPACGFPAGATTSRILCTVSLGQGVTPSTVAISAVSRSGSAATATSNGHTLIQGSVVYVSGADQAEYNGFFSTLAVAHLWRPRA